MTTNKPTEEEQKMFDALLGLPEAVLRHELKLEEDGGDEQEDRPARVRRRMPERYGNDCQVLARGGLELGPPWARCCRAPFHAPPPSG